MPIAAMNMRRIFYWSALLVIICRIILRAFDNWLQAIWQSRLLQTRPMALFWVGIVAGLVGVLALVSAATHFAFFFRRSRSRTVSATAGFLLPHLLLCAVLLGIAIVLGSQSILSQLVIIRIGFLGNFLFYVSLTWFLIILIRSLLPPCELRVEDFKAR